MRRKQSDTHEKSLDERLSAAGKKSLDRLCDEMDCDRQILGNLLVLLAPEQKRFRLKRVSSKSPTDASGPGIRIHPLDSDDALKAFESDLDKSGYRKLDKHTVGEIRDLQRIAQRARLLKQDIEKLRRTAFVPWLKEQGYIDDADLLGGPSIPEFIDRRFRGLLNLPNLAKQVGKRQRPDYTGLLKKIHHHIHERTGGWQDSLLQEILYDLLPEEPGSPRLDLSSWRQRHGLTDAK